MHQAAYKKALVSKRDEILSEGGGKHLQTSQENNTRQGDLADQATGTNEVHIQLKVKQTDAKILQAIEEALQQRCQIDVVEGDSTKIDGLAALLRFARR